MLYMRKWRLREANARGRAEAEDRVMQDIDQWKQKGEVRKKVREVGEKSEVAGSSDQCQGPWEIKQNKK